MQFKGNVLKIYVILSCILPVTSIKATNQNNLQDEKNNPILILKGKSVAKEEIYSIEEKKTSQKEIELGESFPWSDNQPVNIETSMLPLRKVEKYEYSYPPIKYCVKLKIESENKVYFSSGFLINHNIVLTAAHNFLTYKETYDFSYPVTVECYVGKHKNYVMGYSKSKMIFFPYMDMDVLDFSEFQKTFEDRKNKNHDFALIVLEENIGSTVGYFGLGTINLNKKLTTVNLFLAGYPYYIPSKENDKGEFNTEDDVYYRRILILTNVNLPMKRSIIMQKQQQEIQVLPFYAFKKRWILLLSVYI